MYKVIEKFVDLQDNMHLYNVGDEFPHHKGAVSAKRIGELSTTKNRRGIRLIREIEVHAVGAEEPIKPEPQKKKRNKR